MRLASADVVAPRPDAVATRPVPEHQPGVNAPPQGAPGPRRRNAGVRTALAAVAVALALSPIAWDLFRTAADLDRPYFPWGDDALLELNARDALRGRQLTGPYSRFGWHHPGPAEAFVLSLPVRLAGDGPGLPLGSSLWNLGIAAAILALVWRRHGPTAAVIASLAVGVVLAGAPPDTVRQPWNPYMVLLPMLLLLVLVGDVVGSSGVLAGALRDERPSRAWATAGVTSLAWAVVVGTFSLQTHVSTGPTVAALLGLGALSLLVAAWRGRRGGVVPRGWWRRPSAALGLVVAGLLWVPPAWEALTRDPGNPGLMLRFFTQGNPGASPKEAVKASILAMSAFPFGFPPNLIDPGRSRASLIGGLVLLALLGLVALLVTAWRRSGAAAGLLAATVAAGAAAAAANTRINGGIHDYLVVWQESVPGALVIVVGVALGRPRWLAAPDPRAEPPERPATRGGEPGRRRPRRPAPLALPLAALALVAVLTLDNLRFLREVGPAPATSNPGVEAAVAQIGPILRPDDRRVLLRIQDCDAWPAAAGVAVFLEREGRQVAVDGARCSWGEFTVYFERHRRARGDESLELEWVLAGPEGQALTTTPFPGTFLNAEVGWRRLR